MTLLDIETELSLLEHTLAETKSKLNAIKNIERAKDSNAFFVIGVSPLDKVIASYVEYALAQCKGNQTKCAEMLSVSRSTMWRYMSNIHSQSEITKS